VGGGTDVAVSLRELTALCGRISGIKKDIGSDTRTRDADIPYYVTDTSIVAKATGWKPTRSAERILTDIHGWLTAHRDTLAPIFLD
jgi:CDP-paratose 2-epimerase